MFNRFNRAVRLALAHRHEFVIAVLTFTPDHRIMVGVAFAGALALWFVACAIWDTIRRGAYKLQALWRMVLDESGWASYMNA